MVFIELLRVIAVPVFWIKFAYIVSLLWMYKCYDKILEVADYETVTKINQSAKENDCDLPLDFKKHALRNSIFILLLAVGRFVTKFMI